MESHVMNNIKLIIILFQQFAGIRRIQTVSTAGSVNAYIQPLSVTVLTIVRMGVTNCDRIAIKVCNNYNTYSTTTTTTTTTTYKYSPGFK